MTEKGDRFTLSYTALVSIPMLLFIFRHGLDEIFNRNLLLPVIIPTLVVGIVWLAALIRNSFLRRWRRVVSVITAPLLAFAILSGLGAVGVDADRIRFAFGKSSYLAQIAQLPETGEPRFKLFHWAENDADNDALGSLVTVDTLIYDESDEIAVPPDQRSAAWHLRMRRLCPSRMCSILAPINSGHLVEVRKIDGHFYLVTEAFQ